MIEDGSTSRRLLADVPTFDGTRTARNFPAWHFAMLNDRQRTAAIEGAIGSLDLAGKIVFEIGTGSGIVALLFAKHGAEHVYSCEVNSNLANVAEEIVARSRFGSRITILRLSSRQVVEQNLLPRTPDVIFTETVDCGVVGEGFFAIRADVQKIAGPETLVLPIRIEQQGAIIESDSIRSLNEVGQVGGFDLSSFNRFSTRHYLPVRAILHEPKYLSQPSPIRTYDYRRDIDNLYGIVTILRPGVAHGLLSWFTLHFACHSISTIGQVHSHWHQAFHPFTAPLPVRTGQRLHLRLDDLGCASFRLL